MRRARLVAIAVLLVLAVVLAGCGNKVPNVVGMRPQDAIRTLEDAGFKLGHVSYVATTAVDLNAVASQSPAGDTRASRRDETVDLSVNFANGSKALVPAVTGVPVAEASQTVGTVHLSAVVYEQYDTSVTAGVVATQLPAPMTEVAPFSPVLLIVSKGPAPQKGKVPDVKGKSQSDAESAITGAGFTVKSYSAYHDSVAKGSVIGQVPNPGTSLTVGSQVQIIVSLGRGTGAVTVPAVTGKAEADAQAAISSAGLKPRGIYEYDASVPAGKVAKQFPTSGSTAPVGTEVLILISRGPEPAGDVTVPSVTGKSSSSAQSSLEQAGFSVTTQKAAGQTGDEVVYQFPTANTKAAPGSAVLIVLGGTPVEQPPAEQPPTQESTETTP